jgi:hypothetical protein
LLNRGRLGVNWRCTPDHNFTTVGIGSPALIYHNPHLLEGLRRLVLQKGGA